MACMFCTRCGKCAMVKGEADFGRCPVCGTPYADGEAKCPGCHAPRIVPPGAQAAGDRVVSGISGNGAGGGTGTCNDEAARSIRSFLN